MDGQIHEHPTLVGGITPTTIKHPQIEIDGGIMVDEQIAPLVALAIRYGVTTRWSCQGGDDPPFDLAYITFPDLKDAVEFLAQTAQLMDYEVGDKMALSIHRELGPGEGPLAARDRAGAGDGQRGWAAGAPVSSKICSTRR